MNLSLSEELNDTQKLAANEPETTKLHLKNTQNASICEARIYI